MKTSIDHDAETITKAIAAYNKAKKGILKYNLVGGLMSDYTPSSEATNCRSFAEGLGK